MEPISYPDGPLRERSRVVYETVHGSIESFQEVFLVCTGGCRDSVEPKNRLRMKTRMMRIAGMKLYGAHKSCRRELVGIEQRSKQATICAPNAFICTSLKADGLLKQGLLVEDEPPDQ